MQKQLLQLLVLLLCFTTSVAQTPNHYVFSQSNAPYTELSADTAVTPAFFGSGNLYWFDFLTGDTFTFFNNSVVFDTSRYLAFSTDGYVVATTDTDRMLVCDGLFRSMDSLDQNSKLSYQVEGTGNNKIVKVQWKNLSIRSGQPGNYVNFQIWVHQATGVIEYHYGPSSPNNASGYTVFTGPSIGITYNDVNFTQVYEKIWLSNTPANLSVDTSKTISYPNIQGVPPEGTVYRFIPRSLTLAAGGLVQEEKFSYFPNPVNKQLTLAFAEAPASPAIVTLRDIQGRIVLQTIAAAGERRLRLNTASLIPGNYYLFYAGRPSGMISVAH